jgi:hypothetical protein
MGLIAIHWTLLRPDKTPTAMNTRQVANRNGRISRKKKETTIAAANAVNPHKKSNVARKNGFWVLSSSL